MRTALLSLLGICLVVSTGESQSTCNISGTVTPSVRALAESGCTRAEQRFAELFGQPAPAGELVLSDTLIGFSFEFPPSGWRLHFPTRGIKSEDLGIDSLLSDHWNSLLPHELGHAMLAALVEPGVPQPAGRYGTVLPDWLDEAVAIWMEPEGSRDDELRNLFRTNDAAPTIAEFMQQPHPTLADTLQAYNVTTNTWYPCPSAAACPDRERWDESMRVRSWTMPDGSTGADTVYFRGNPPEAEALARGFYPFSLLMLEFVHERGGSEAVRELTMRLARDPDSPTAWEGLPGLPDTAEELENAWQRWFTERAQRQM